MLISNNKANFLPRNNLLIQIEDIYFNCNYILKVIQHINNIKSRGPDNSSCC